MKAVIQRVKKGTVSVEGNCVGAIDKGIVALIALEPHDNESNMRKLVEKILKYRIFSDENDHMNLSLKDIQGGLLLISQFTLAANTNSGLRPSFDTAMKPSEAQELFSKLVSYTKQLWPQVQCGEFGADMQVELINDGPVTFILTA
ncbi:MAG: D-aminoacyl-tRNA deacylase [Succinatimonas sp.]|nr:D-aminoacyl-tRNA deacylase [Succinatimonas sp.]